MLFIGCLGLPFLWFVNVLHFRKRVFGETPFLDWDEHDEFNNNTTATEASTLAILGSSGDNGKFVTQNLMSLSLINWQCAFCRLMKTMNSESSAALEHAIETELKNGHTVEPMGC